MDEHRHPTLTGERVTLRPGHPSDAAALRDVLAEPSVTRWWGTPPPLDEIAADMRGDGDTVLLVIEVDGRVGGGIQYVEESDAMYRHAGIDIFLGARCQSRGAGTEAMRLLVDFLIGTRGHHRLTIDPAVANARAIRVYEKVGFRPVGIMRRYERGPDGTYHDGLLMDLLASDLATAPGT